MWDSDGAGPLAPVLVAGGDFTAAGTANPVAGIATWDGTNWSALPGATFAGTIDSVVPISSNNNLFAVGRNLTSFDGMDGRRVAGFNGSTWFGTGTGTGNTPSLTPVAAAPIGTDSLAIAGAFTAVAGVSANRIAVYNTSTSTWSALGDGMSSTTSAIHQAANGNIYAGGAALQSGSTTINRIARWDGTTWNAMGSGLNGGLVRTITSMPNGDIIVAGAFLTSGDNTQTLSKIARWDGTAWHPLGDGINFNVGAPNDNLDPYDMAVAPNGDLIVVGDFSKAGTVNVGGVARWNGTTWGPLFPGDVGANGPVRAVEVLPNGDIAIAGDFTSVGGQPHARFAVYSASGPVSINSQPVSTEVGIDDIAEFIVGATGGTLTYQWQQQDLFNLPDFVDINDGPVYDPFFNEIATASGATTAHLTLSNLQGVAQVFRVKITNSCGTVYSNEVTLTFTPACIADFDQDGNRTIDDIFIFINAWFADDPRTDVDGNGRNIDDIFIFLNLWFAGCP
jgi:hypothetical protein